MRHVHSLSYTPAHQIFKDHRLPHSPVLLWTGPTITHSLTLCLPMWFSYLSPPYNSPWGNICFTTSFFTLVAALKMLPLRRSGPGGIEWAIDSIDDVHRHQPKSSSFIISPECRVTDCEGFLKSSLLRMELPKVGRIVSRRSGCRVILLNVLTKMRSHHPYFETAVVLFIKPLGSSVCVTDPDSSLWVMGSLKFLKLKLVHALKI